MAPSKPAPGPPFAKDEKVLCFHGDLMYEAKITEVRSASDPTNHVFSTIKADDAQYKVHYKGWKSSWDDWVSQDRIRKFTDDNKALATQLQQAARARTAGGSKSAKKAIGKAVGGVDSEMSSARGSEERAANNSYAGRGPRRGRDYELESDGHNSRTAVHGSTQTSYFAAQVYSNSMLWAATVVWLEQVMEQGITPARASRYLDCQRAMKYNSKLITDCKLVVCWLHYPFGADSTAGLCGHTQSSRKKSQAVFVLYLGRGRLHPVQHAPHIWHNPFAPFLTTLEFFSITKHSADWHPSPNTLPLHRRFSIADSRTLVHPSICHPRLVGAMDDAAPKKWSNSSSSSWSSVSSGRRRTRRSSPMPLEEMHGFEKATQMAMELSKKDEERILRDLERAERDAAAAAAVDAAVAAAATAADTSFNPLDGAKDMVSVGDLANTIDSNKENHAPKVVGNDRNNETQAAKDVPVPKALSNSNIARRSTRLRQQVQRLHATLAQATTVAQSPTSDLTVEHEPTQELSSANVTGTKRKGSSKKPQGKKNKRATTTPTAAPPSNTTATKKPAPAKKKSTTAKKATPVMDRYEEDRKAFIIKEAKYAKAQEPYDRLRQGPPPGRTYVSRSGQLLLGPEDPPYHRVTGTVPSRAQAAQKQATQKKEAKPVSSHRQVKYVPTDKPMPTAGIPSDRPSRPKQNMQRFADAIARTESQPAAESEPLDLSMMIEDQSVMHRWLMANDPNYVRLRASVGTPAHFLNRSEEATQTVSGPSAENTVDEDTLLAAHALLSLAAGRNLGPQEFTETRYESPIEAPVSTAQYWRHLQAKTPSLTIGKLEFLSPLKRLNDGMQEDAFHHRPSIKIVLPDMLKGLLVDDWEAVTKTNQLVPLPHPKPVTVVLDNYLEYEKAQRQEGSASIDILEETIAGLKEYFDKCLGRILLYRFERAQYAEVREKWITEGSDLYGKSASDTYGSEHLMRLFTSLPELVAQTNMDQQSVNRLREELTKFTQWLTRNAGDYFLNEYEAPSAEYSEKAKN